MKIGELSKLTGISVRSIRHYEQQGLVTPDRLPNGYRDYHALAVEQVNTIQFYIRLGLTTEQIAGFLHCVLINKESFCSEVLPVYKQKLDDINRQIDLLTRIKSNLEERIHSIRREQNETTEEDKHEHFDGCGCGV